jgi:hypothetical protein
MLAMETFLPWEVDMKIMLIRMMSVNFMSMEIILVKADYRKYCDSFYSD